MKVKELGGMLLDYWTQRAYTKDDTEFSFRHQDLQAGKFSDDAWAYELAWGRGWCDPSSDWAQGGKIIEDARITVQHMGDSLGPEYQFAAFICIDGEPVDGYLQMGETYLIAAMRCFVCLKFGESVPCAKN